MKLSSTLLAVACSGIAAVAAAAGNWAITDAKFSLIRGGTTIRSGDIENLPAIDLDHQTTLELVFGTTKDDKPAKPHQASVLVRDPASGVEFAYAAVYKSGTKARISIPYSAIPKNFHGTADPLEIELLVASFGDAKPLRRVLTKQFTVDPSGKYEPPHRLHVKPEIHHIFSQDPKTVSSFVALVFSAASVFLFLVLLVAWASTGSASLKNLSKALKAAPISYLGLLGSIVGYETLFLLYFKEMSVFDALTYGSVLAPVAIYTGSRALREFSTRV